MVVYGAFLELHDFYSGEPFLIRAKWISSVSVVGEATYIDYVVDGTGNIVVKEDYETVKGLLGQVYGKRQG